MSKLSYWERRKAERMVKDMDKAEKMSDNLDEIYNLANRHITSKIDGIFERFRQDHGLTEDEAKRILQNVDNLADFNELRRAMDSATDSEELRQLAIVLDSASYASRIKRYESLQQQVTNIKQPIFKAENEQTGAFYKGLAENVYYQSTFDIQQQSGIGYSFDNISRDTISEVVNQRWLGKNYSERIWDNTTQLANELQKELAISLLTGRSYSETTDVINGRFNKGKTNARRLVRTESAHIHAEMEAKSYEEADIEYYRFLATLDLRTSSICREHDGQVYKLSERQTGINYPPMHPWCRSDTIASFDEDWLNRIKRRARDPETGRNITVPGDMTYNDWYDQYVEKPRERELSGKEFGVDLDYVRSDQFANKIKNHPQTAPIADSVTAISRRMLQHRNGTAFEDYYLLDAQSGKVVALSNKARKKKGVVYNDQVKNAFKNSAERSLVSIHNHPSGYPPSLSDFASLQQRSKNNTIKYGLTAGHDGSIYWYTRPNKRIPRNAEKEYLNSIEKLIKIGYTEVKAQEETLKVFSEKFDFKFERIE